MALTTDEVNELEKLQARRDGATLVKNSGRGMRKGDARTNVFLIDYKFTEKGSFSLNLNKFRKHQKDAWHEAREGVIVAVFMEDNQPNRTVAMVDWDWLKECLEKAERYDDLCR